MAQPDPVLRLGAVGLGRAFASMAPSLIGHSRVQLVAAADPHPDARRNCARDFGARTYEDAEQLFADPNVDAIYIATPHELHLQHCLRAFGAGKHVLVEKPMAMSLNDCQTMVDAARQSGRQLVVGHSHGFDRPFVQAARAIAAGAYGQVRMVSALNYTNWIYRPRRPEELAPDSAGVVLNQASHQVDIVRMLAGGMATSVRASTGAWDPLRPAIGAYSALLQFDSGAFASLTYNGYDHFDSDEFNGWVGELGRSKAPDQSGSARRLLAAQAGADAEVRLKAGVGYAAIGAAPVPDTVDGVGQWHQQFGLVLVSCDRADLRIGARGIAVYSANGVQHIPVPAGMGARAGVFDELHAAATTGQATMHSGRWGMANLEVCLGTLESSRKREEVRLLHQVPVVLGSY